MKSKAPVTISTRKIYEEDPEAAALVTTAADLTGRRSAAPGTQYVRPTHKAQLGAVPLAPLALGSFLEAHPHHLLALERRLLQHGEGAMVEQQ